MGIKNFTSIISATNYSYSDTPQYYDAILIDIQSVLYINITRYIKNEDYSIHDIVKDLCQDVITYIGESLASLFQKERHDNKITIIIAFDGKGVPMKWPTQCERRKDNIISNNKQLILNSLFEHNSISKEVCDYITARLNDCQWMKFNFFSFVENLPEHIIFYISGSNKDGEGEHKLFNIAKQYNCQHVLVYSVDNDVFIISFIRRHQFKSIQITKDGKKFFHVSSFLNDYLKYDVEKLIYASFLFGNDFIPEYISLTPKNATVIHEILHNINSTDIVEILRQLIIQLHEIKKINFKFIKRVQLMIPFWINCIWILDYYEKENFPQKFIENHYYFMSDRDKLLSFLCNYKSSKYCYDEAKEQYRNIDQCSMKIGKYEVFNSDTLQKIQPFLIERDIIPYMTKIIWITKSVI